MQQQIDISRHRAQGLDWQIFPCYSHSTPKLSLRLDDPVYQQLTLDSDYFNRFKQSLRFYTDVLQKSS